MKAESWAWAAVTSSGFNMIMTTHQISSKIKVLLLWLCNGAQSWRGSEGSCGSTYANLLSLKRLRGHGWASDVFIQARLTHPLWQEKKAFYIC